MTTTAIVILNFNGEKHLSNFLPSVLKHSNPENEIWVIDNCSTDNSIDYLKQKFPSVKIIQNTKNGGFAKGYNDGLKKIKSDFYILINSDIEATPNWDNPLIELLKNNSNIAACQPKIKSYKNRSKFEHAGAAGGFIDKYAYAFCRGRIFADVEEDLGQYDDTIEIFWATGAAMAIKASLFHKLGGFDEDFFAHMEEIDLCWRLKNNGYSIFYTSKSTVYHLGGGTLDYQSPKKVFLNFRNNLFMILKNVPSNRVYKLLMLRLLLDGLAGIKFFSNSGFAHLKAIINAHFSFYKLFFKMKNKRYNIESKNHKNGTYHGALFIDYFAKGRKKFGDLPQKLF